MEVKKLVLGELRTNCYFVINGNDCIVIDSACYSNLILDFAKQNNLNIKAVLLTHGHFDHCSACKELQQHGISVYMSKLETDILKNNARDLGIRQSCVFTPDFIVNDGDILNLIGLNFEVILTSGHTEGSVCYKVNNHLFSGDTIFCGGYGRCDLFSGNFNKIKISITEKLYTLNEDIVVYPGHGESTTIKQEKMLNHF